MQIRPVEAADVPDLVRFIHELAAYEREPDAVRITPDQLTAALFGASPHLFGLVAVDGGVPVGMALWFLNFSTWDGVHGIYVEDLYVSPEARGLGAGRALLQELARTCRQRGYSRLDLSVLDWNSPAIGFYRRLGAHGLDEWTTQRITGEALAALATG